MMIAKLILSLIFSVYTNITDWKTYKIRNRGCVTFFVLALLVQAQTGGVAGVLSALKGSGIMLVLFPLFALRMLGAGDIKALMAIGAMVGWPIAGKILISSILSGGLLAMIILLIRKNGRVRAKKLWGYIKVCFYSMSIQPYSNKLQADDGNFRFSFGITAGTFIVLAGCLV